MSFMPPLQRVQVMQDPRENFNSISEMIPEIDYLLNKEVMSNVFDALRTIEKSIFKLYLSSCKNDQDVFEIFCSYDNDKKQIETNIDLLVLMHQHILLIKNQMDILNPHEDPISSLIKLDDQIKKLNSDFILYNSLSENNSERFQRYNKIINIIICFQQTAEVLLASLKIELLNNFEENHFQAELLLSSNSHLEELNFYDPERGQKFITHSEKEKNEHNTTTRSQLSLALNDYDHNNYNGDVFVNIPVEIQLLLISFMPCRVALSLGMTAKYYSDLINSIDLWRGFFKRDFSYHYPALTVFENYEHIDWKNEYKLAKKNPPWPFPFVSQQDTVSPNPFYPIIEAITLGLVDVVISNIKQGMTISSLHLKHAITRRFSPFILELLIAAINDINELNIALCFACKYNNSMAAAILIKAGADVNCKIFDKKLKDHLSPFHYAIQRSNLFLVKMLLDLGAEPFDTKKYPLIYFLLDNYHHFNDLKVFDIFYNIDFNQTYEANNRSISLLEKAINSHDESHANNTVKWLLENGANPDTLISGLDETPVFYYLISRHKVDIQLIKTFLKYNPNLEHRDANGRTAIFYSIYLPSCQMNEITEIFLLLLHRKVNLAVTDNYGQTVLHYFLTRQNFRNNLDDIGFQSILDCLLNHININIKDNYGICPLDLAMDNVSALVPMIIMNLIPANSCDKNQENVFHKFAKWDPININSLVKKRMKNIFSFLIKKGADPNKKNKEDDSPLQVAINHNNVLAFESLIANGIKIAGLYYVKKYLSNEIKNAIDCYHYVELAMTLIKNNNSLFSISALISPVKIDYYIRNAFHSNFSLCTFILLNYLSGNELTSKQKERLIDILDSCSSSNRFLWKNLAEGIICNDNCIDLPPNRIVLVLERYLKILENQQENIFGNDDVEIQKILEFLENYKSIRDLSL